MVYFVRQVSFQLPFLDTLFHLQPFRTTVFVLQSNENLILSKSHIHHHQQKAMIHQENKHENQTCGTTSGIKTSESKRQPHLGGSRVLLSVWGIGELFIKNLGEWVFTFRES